MRIYPALLALVLALLLAVAGGGLRAEAPDPAAPWNGLILDAMRAMPAGGGYSSDHAAKRGLIDALAVTPAGFAVAPERARPSFCSGATYLVFLKAVDALARRGDITLDDRARAALLIGNQIDGEGVWGRWNANGPGTARLFRELEIGTNFSRFDLARPGDFMKIFWSTKVGRLEHGHSVIYLGVETVNGVENVRFWSSNIGVGYGEKVVPRAKIAAAVFSRLRSPGRLSGAATLTPRVDPYLASLLTKDSNLGEVQERCGM